MEYRPHGVVRDQTYLVCLDFYRKYGVIPPQWVLLEAVEQIDGGRLHRTAIARALRELVDQGRLVQPFGYWAYVPASVVCRSRQKADAPEQLDLERWLQ